MVNDIFIKAKEILQINASPLNMGASKLERWIAGALPLGLGANSTQMGLLSGLVNLVLVVLFVIIMESVLRVLA